MAITSQHSKRSIYIFPALHLLNSNCFVNIEPHRPFLNMSLPSAFDQCHSFLILALTSFITSLTLAIGLSLSFLPSTAHPSFIPYFTALFNVYGLLISKGF